MNEFNRHKKSDKIKWVFTGIAFLLVAVMLTSICLQLFGTGKQKPSEWFKKTECVHIDENADGKCDKCKKDMPADGKDENKDNGGAVINESVSRGVKLMSARIAPTAYAENGISAQAESAYTLTATVLPADTADKSVDWSVAWKNPSSNWASGKTVTNYVTVTPVTGETAKASVACLAAFGEQVIVKAISRDNSSASGECTVDYAQKVLGLTFAIGDIAFSNNETITVNYELAMGVYGVGGTPSFGCNLSDTYTLAEQVTFPASFEIKCGSSSSFNYKLTVKSKNPTAINFDRRFFLTGENCVFTYNSMSITTENFFNYSVSDVNSWVNNFNSAFDRVPNIVFSATTKYGGTVNFASNLKLKAVNHTTVTGVNLDKSGIRF